MIKELAIFRLRAGEGHRFETAFAGVVTQLTGADGYLKHRLVPTLDDAEVYILEVDWRDLASHIQGFEPSEAHERFISALDTPRRRASRDPPTDASTIPLNRLRQFRSFHTKKRRGPGRDARTGALPFRRNHMKAVGYRTAGPITAENSLVDIDLPSPGAPTGLDILVKVKAVSVNPVDFKVRRSATPPGDEWKVLGWDASGVVIAVGPDATRFKPGDEVYYAGSITRPGSNAEFQLVDERIVAQKPTTLDWAESAALPLTTLTAWEAVFERLNVTRSVPGAAPAILIIGGAGGVGSIAIQIARQCTELTVIATASRPETADWAKSLGAHHVIDHSRSLAPQIAELGLGAPAFVFSTTHSGQHTADVAELIAPQGRFALIDDPEALDIMVFKRKAVSIHHELMFTRAIYETPDMAEQGVILNYLAHLVDEGRIRTTLTERLSPINAANLKHVHERLEGGRTRGKIVLEGF